MEVEKIDKEPDTNDALMKIADDIEKYDLTAEEVLSIWQECLSIRKEGGFW